MGGTMPGWCGRAHSARRGGRGLVRWTILSFQITIFLAFDFRFPGRMRLDHLILLSLPAPPPPVSMTQCSRPSPPPHCALPWKQPFFGWGERQVGGTTSPSGGTIEPLMEAKGVLERKRLLRRKKRAEPLYTPGVTQFPQAWFDLFPTFIERYHSPRGGVK